MKLNGIITYRGLEVNKNDIISKFGHKGYKSLLRKFIIKYKSPIGTFFIEKKNYIINKDIILFPRFGANDLLQYKILNNIENKIQDGNKIDIVYKGIPTRNQEIVIDHIFNTTYSEKNKQDGLCGLTLQLLAGGGKTFLAMDILSKLKVKTLIVVPNTYLLNQWVELLTEFFPNSKIGQYYGKKKTDGDIVVAIINSLINDEFLFDNDIKINNICEIEKCDNKAFYNIINIININNPTNPISPIYCNKHKSKDMIKIKNKKIIEKKTYSEFFKEFGFVILDESHIYCTDSFKIIYNIFK